jgi:hypothetical protein
MIISESKYDDLLGKYLPKFNNRRDRFSEALTPEIIIKHLYELDPSPTKKYFEWMIKACLDIIDGNYVITNEVIRKLVTDVITFNENLNKLGDDFLEYNRDDIGDVAYKYLKGKPLNDINSYNRDILRKIIQPLINYKTESQRKKLAKDGASLIYKNDNYFVYEINSHDASCFYGRGSKWCTTTPNSDGNFRSYGTGSNKLLYVINRKETIESDPQFYKIAVNIRVNDEKIVFYDAPDKTFDGWDFFRVKDPNIMEVIIGYVKKNNPDTYMDILPVEVVATIEQTTNNLSDFEVLTKLPVKKSLQWLNIKYGYNLIDNIRRKLNILIDGGITNEIGDYFTDDEKRYVINTELDFLKEKGLTWKNFISDRFVLITLSNGLELQKIIELFFDGNKNEIFRDSRGKDIISYLIGINEKYITELIDIYGREKIIKFYVKNNDTNSILGKLFYFLNGLNNKQKKGICDLIFENDKSINGIYDYIDFLIYCLGRGKSIIASFNDGDGFDVEDDSYRKAFMYFYRNNIDDIMKVFEIRDLSKVFKTPEKALIFLFRNVDIFKNDDGELSMSDICSLFDGKININTADKKYRYGSDFDRKRIENKAQMVSSANKFLDFLLEKSLLKKAVGLFGYDEIFKLFSINTYKKGVNFFIKNKIGNVDISDIRIVDGKPILVVTDMSEYDFLFYESEFAKKALSDDIYDWEPYGDIVYDWYDQVWLGAVNKKTIGVVKEWILKHVSEYDDGDDVITINEGFLGEIDDDDLGHIIDKFDEFDDLKNEMRWSYEYSYNNAVVSKFIKDHQDGLETYLGKYLGNETVKKVKPKYDSNTKKAIDMSFEEIHHLYDVGDSLYELLFDYAFENWDYYVDYDTLFLTLLKDTNYDKISVNDEPYISSSEIEEIFNEDILDRI